jgi:hypothetical protein
MGIAKRSTFAAVMLTTLALASVESSDRQSLRAAGSDPQALSAPGTSDVPSSFVLQDGAHVAATQRSLWQVMFTSHR